MFTATATMPENPYQSPEAEGMRPAKSRSYLLIGSVAILSVLLVLILYSFNARAPVPLETANESALPSEQGQSPWAPAGTEGRFTEPPGRSQLGNTLASQPASVPD